MSEKSVNFRYLIDKMQQARLANTDQPTVLGGQFIHDRLIDFLAVWRKRWSDMQWRFWEHISHIEFAEEPKEPDYLQRAVIFGNGGHLSLRRDSSRWLWHYIGPADQPSPEGFDQMPPCEVWSADGSIVLRRHEDRAILWGKRKAGFDFWWEDRVAAAELVYPNQAVGWVYLDFWRYTQDGQTVFVWYRKLSSDASNQ